MTTVPRTRACRFSSARPAAHRRSPAPASQHGRMGRLDLDGAGVDSEIARQREGVGDRALRRVPRGQEDAVDPRRPDGVDGDGGDERGVDRRRRAPRARRQSRSSRRSRGWRARVPCRPPPPRPSSGAMAGARATEGSSVGCGVTRRSGSGGRVRAPARIEEPFSIRRADVEIDQEHRLLELGCGRQKGAVVVEDHASRRRTRARPARRRG